jgi:hypothetical protein
MTAFVPTVALLLLAQTPQPATKPLTPQEIQSKVFAILSGAGPQIDACTEAYTNEFPANAGKVDVAVYIVKDGTVSKAEVSTTLDGARNLRPCLEAVAKRWKMPPINVEQERLNLTIQVKKGVKFALAKPGEKAAQQGGETKPEEQGFVSFLPQSFGGGN